MIKKQNLHTHSTFCDGKDSPEEMILAAISQDFDSIGFSGHSYMECSKVYTMSPEATALYNAEIERLKAKYSNKIKIYRGLEADIYSDISREYDYLIGSVHVLKINGEPVPFDRDKNTVEGIINKYFGGNGLAYAKEFYRTVATLPQYGKFDIIGHFDLITKHIESSSFFDTESKEYKGYWMEALDALSGKVPLFEINTGAISRGYRTTPYPMPDIIKEMKNKGFGAVITSDCHDKNFLDCYRKEAEALLLECGFKSINVLTDDGFKEIGLGE